MTVKYYAILTNQGAARLANATMLGSKLNLTQMAVGDANGVLPTPDPAQTKLINQKRIAPLNLLSVDPNNQSQIIAEQIIPENEGGFWIREIGLYDDEGVLIAVANCPETYKPQLQEGSGRTQTIRMILVVSNTEAITLKIDPSVVLATRKYVDDKISEHEQSRRHPDASLTAKGFTQLSSATNSTSETLAATPRAVKVAYDLANGKYTAQDATTARKGLVQLSSATNSDSETLAATPKAVKTAYDLANGKYTAQDATTARKGLVQLSSATNSTSETQAATPKAVKAVYDLANGKQPADATLTALAGLATAADKLPYFTGNDTASLTTLTNVGRNILDKASTQAVIQYLGLSDASGYVGRWLNTRVFTSSGTYTPTPGTKRIRVTITGGGGGGGGCKATSNNETFFGAGGGAGGTIISIITPTQNSYPVTIGAGGAGGVSATNGTSGGNSVFASLIAPGGAGGGKVGVTNTNGGNGGVPSTGDIRITGGNGGDGQSGNISVSGEGGTSYWGGGGRAGAGGGVSGKAYGSGGGGAYDAGYSGTSMTGGKGAAGICIIEEFA
ncbi:MULTISPECIES: phage tail protein [Enterobacteriaceae]|uniref:phage tail-collar fiber domain-containing protein n=1 Tax=Enterobacteriaceae TaxID=543 RepID=UPI000B956EE0|nr:MULTISPECIES: phage tail protein [Enterobacteriaceae]MBB0930315.1 phage tail protein [Escherichia coli]MBX4689659.1 phage tail protein [Klebsiella pneumoniae]MCI1177747.1 phage tail protein [Escherichia coli]MCX2024656.1 phage tail protein [Escherichia coli]MDB8070662.1 phage tail protein [Escherichia coli]